MSETTRPRGGIQMSTDYSDHYTWTGWFEGTDCTPEEPGKEWLTIEEDGNEYAVVVLRTDAFTDAPLALAAARNERETRAERIIAALNAYHNPKEGNR